MTGNLFRSLRKAFSAFHGRVKGVGGYNSALRQVVALVRHEGLPAIWFRIHPSLTCADDALRDVSEYERWIAAHDCVSVEMLGKIRAAISNFSRLPLISVVMPTYDTVPILLRAAIESVRAQVYENWELCIADDASTNTSTTEVLREYAALDHRIKVVFRPLNGHISAASNSAVDLATGEYVALLDHDDTISPHALYVVAKYINEHPNGRLFYSDEDKILPSGARAQPHFKPDWNPELIRVQNFFSHLGVFETRLLREAGAFRIGYEGSQDHDLLLRCIDRCVPSNIIHIPHILYHWRLSPGSTAGESRAKPYAVSAAFRAVEDHLQRNNLKAALSLPVAGTNIFRVQYEAPASQPKVSIILIAGRALETLKKCLGSLLAKTSYSNFELVILCDGSIEAEIRAYLEKVTEKAQTLLVMGFYPFNYAALNNRAVQEAKGAYVCLLDIGAEIISADWIEEMVSIASIQSNGAVGARLWNSNDTLQHAGIVLGLQGAAGHIHAGLPSGSRGYFNRAVLTQNYSAVTAACLMVSKASYLAVAGLDEDFQVAFSDVDFCLKLREAGFWNVWTPYAELYCRQSPALNEDESTQHAQHFLADSALLRVRWPLYVKRDPSFNPNLSLRSLIPALSSSDLPRVSFLT